MRQRVATEVEPDDKAAYWLKGISINPGQAWRLVADEEERFEDGQRRNAMEMDAFDTNHDGQLDFREFCALVGEREAAESASLSSHALDQHTRVLGRHSMEELRARFAELDADGSGLVDIAEYIRYSLRDALTRSADRVMDLMYKWDADGSGAVTMGEFRRALRAVGFDKSFCRDADIDEVFAEFDDDSSGAIDYKELNKALRTGAGSAADGRQRRALRKGGAPAGDKKGGASALANAQIRLVEGGEVSITIRATPHMVHSHAVCTFH